ncbi:hypothetical protein vseg_014033 [Gypsophila vaccaria]
MGLRDIGATLPPGFRFYPSDEELVCHYLHKKIVDEDSLKGTLVDIDLHICEPWQLPEVAKLNASEWYFFSFRDRKYATGFRTNRATTCGYWKATGKDRVILGPKTKEVVGMRKTLVFYRNRAPNGTKTGWIMHEFRLECPHMPPKEDWVLCRVFHKGKTGENNNNNNNNINNDIISNYNTQYQYIFDNNHTIPYECQKPNSFSSNSPTYSQNKSTIDHNDMSRNYLNSDDTTNPNSNMFPLNPTNLLQIVKEDDDNYECLWDMNLDENSKLGEEGTLPQHGWFEDNNISSTIFI